MTSTTQPKSAVDDGFDFSVATAPSTARHRQLALAVVIATLVAYVAITPHATVQLPRVVSFIPTMFAIIFVADLVTAVLLYAQFSATGSRPLLVLASGYLFSSLIVVGHVLVYPGVFAPEGLLGAGPQSAAWLNVLWRFGLAASIAGYAVLRSREQANNAIEPAPRFAISGSVAIVVVVVGFLIFAVTAGHEFVPPVLLDSKILPLGRYANGVIVLMDLVALLLLLVLTRGRSVLDLWLIVVAVALLAESMVITFLVVARFSFAFYAMRVIALPISKVVLVVLLWESMRLYGRLSASNSELRRERASRLTTDEAAKKARDELDVAMTRVRNLVEQGSDAIFIADLEGRFTDVNSAGHRLLGYSKAEIAGKTILDMILPEEIPRFIQHREHLLAGGVEIGEWSLRRKDGTLVTAEVSAKILPDGQWQSFVRDVTERKKVEEKNARLYHELEQAVIAREEVLAVVSHDLGNPLAAISLVTTVLQRHDLAQDDRLKEYVSSIATSVDQMKRLLRDLQDFSKMQSGTFSVKKNPEKAMDVLSSAIVSVRSLAEGRRQTLTTDIPATLPQIMCDRHRIVQALSNLLGNAVKFTPEGGAISVQAGQRGSEVVMSVSDNGPGISPEDLPRIFDRFWQADATRNTGAGLGLTIVKGIAEAHGGRIWAESQVGVGSSFHFAIPSDGTMRRDDESEAHNLAGR